MTDIIYIMQDDSMDDWDRLFVRLGTLRLVGGVPALRLELDKLTDEALDVLNEAAINTVIHVNIETLEQVAAFEIAALINELQHDRKNENG
jgi:hypothetical protein|tara:strand:+ start:134 stop:406 length:273 start_codon:yes stop_codon:yes gene_type:complete